MTELSKTWQQGSPPTAFKPKKPFIPRLVRSNKPDHIIGPHSVLQGRFEFKGLLRVEGRFEGLLRPAEGSNVVVGRGGVILGDVEGCHSVMVEGKVIGSVSANVVDLRRNAYIEGNVWCKDLAAASTAVFRNRAAATPTASSQSQHRRSSSTSSEQGLVTTAAAAGENGSGGSGSSFVRSASILTRRIAGGGAGAFNGGGSGGGSSGGSHNTSPVASGILTTASMSPSSVERAPTSAAAPATATPVISRASSSVSLSEGATAGSGVAQDVIAAAISAELPPDCLDCSGGGAARPGSGCSFPKQTGGAAAEGGGTEAVGVKAPSRSSGSIENVANGGGCGSGGGSSTPGSSSSPSPEQSWVPADAPVLPPLSAKGKNASSGASPPPATPPPPPNTRRFMRVSSGASHVKSSSMESPPRSRRQAARVSTGSRSSLRVRGGAAKVRGGSGGCGASGGSSGTAEREGGGGKMAGCPFPHDIQQKMKQEQREWSLDKMSRPANGGGRGTSNSQPDWRKGGTDYGVQSLSLTQAFSSVAMLLTYDGQTGFEEHLQMEYAAENLWFWKEGMNFRSRKFESSRRRREEARRIFDAYLSVDSLDQVNISHEDRENVLAALESRPGAQAIGAGLFDEALVQVEVMLALGPFPRFTANTVRNIESSWKKVEESYGEYDAGESFFSVLFEISPSAESLFTRSTRVQGEMFMVMVNSAVKLLTNLEELVPALIQLGLKHNAYKVRREHFPVVEAALMATLGMLLQEEFTEDVRQSWVVVLRLMSNIMMSVLDPPPLEDDKVDSMADSMSASSASSSSISSTDFRGNSLTPPPDNQRAGPALGLCTSLTGSVRSSAAAAALEAPPPMTVLLRKNSSAGADAAAGGWGKSRGGGGDVESGSAAVSASASGGSGVGGSSSLKGIYRRGTNSFRNQFSRLVRKESNAGARGLASPHTTGAVEAAVASSALAAASAVAAATERQRGRRAAKEAAKEAARFEGGSPAGGAAPALGMAAPRDAEVAAVAADATAAADGDGGGSGGGMA